jgi:hypothetical protein
MSKRDKIIWDQFQLDPTDNARAHYIARMMSEGKISFGERSAEADQERDFYWLGEYGRVQAQADQLSAELEALKAAKSRNRFVEEDRLLIWKHTIYDELTHGRTRRDENGFRIGWTARRYAIEQYTWRLWEFSELASDTLRKIILRSHAAGRTCPDLEDMLQPVGERSKRTAPRQQDWTALRDRLEGVTA